MVEGVEKVEKVEKVKKVKKVERVEKVEGVEGVDGWWVECVSFQSTSSVIPSVSGNLNSKTYLRILLQLFGAELIKKLFGKSFHFCA